MAEACSEVYDAIQSVELKKRGPGAADGSSTYVTGCDAAYAALAASAAFTGCGISES